MTNFQDTFESYKWSFICAFSIYMTAPLRFELCRLCNWVIQTEEIIFNQMLKEVTFKFVPVKCVWKKFQEVIVEVSNDFVP